MFKFKYWFLVVFLIFAQQSAMAEKRSEGFCPCRLSGEQKPGALIPLGKVAPGDLSYDKFQLTVFSGDACSGLSCPMFCVYRKDLEKADRVLIMSSSGLATKAAINGEKKTLEITGLKIVSMFHTGEAKEGLLIELPLTEHGLEAVLECR